MKNLYKIGLILLFLLCTLILTVRAEAADIDTELSGESYTITYSGSGYEAYKSSGSYTQPAFKSDKLSELISQVSTDSKSARIHFFDVVCSEHIVFGSCNYILSGNIDFLGDGRLTIEGGEIILSKLTLTFQNEGVRLKKGLLKVDDSEIRSKSCAIKMDYSSLSELIVNSGSISSGSTEGTLVLNYGTAKIGGGSIKNSIGVAIRTSATLVLSGCPEISGVDWDVYASSPITLEENNNTYIGNCTVKYNSEFSKGKISIFAYGANSENEKNIKLIDALGREIPVKYYDSFPTETEKNFLTAYIPYIISFGDAVEEEKLYYLQGEKVTLPEPEERQGYEFLGWKIGSSNGELYEPSIPLVDDMALYPSYRLNAPSFSFLSMQFTYDGSERYLELSELSHPLLSEGVMSYKWYKDGEEVSFYGDKIPLKNVSDGGKYKCLFTFSHKSHSVTVQTPEISITVNKRKVDIPLIPSVEYNGEVRYPEIYSVSLYTAEYEGAVDAGVYPVRLTLRDAENYVFGESAESVVTVFFEVTKAQNEWIEAPFCSDIYLWQALLPTATAKFGQIKFYFSKSIDGEYTEVLPTVVGAYYMKGVVEETANYTGIISEAVKFAIMQDSIASLHIVSEAVKKNYTAFESFSGEGLRVAARYVSGKEVILADTDITFGYREGMCFLFGDSYVLISHGGKSIVYPITVLKAEYDLSGILFADSEYEYCAKYISPVFSGRLPTGLDGIPLTASVVGGGTGVGTYVVELKFFSQSENYNTPESLSAIMTVLPKEVDVIWRDMSFVYDGKIKSPTAYYTDISGVDISLNVSGARSYAGNYEASVSIPDVNYSAKNPSCTFIINKGYYDLSGVRWSSEQLVYNGTEQRVLLLGLPIGISVIGYSDNRATDAGSYVASVTLSYDENNYNPPTILPYEWEIMPSQYDESGFDFSDAVFVYDGEEHFPIFSGTMPLGVDGSIPTFAFSQGATNVDDGRVCVIISFSTESKNYVAPKSRECFVEILPKGITVNWSNLTCVYTGALFLPSVEAEECEVAVVGAVSDAGLHTATAKALNTNYFVINSECNFEILKAENFWESTPSISNIYSSGILVPCGAAAFGETSYIYSRDKAEVINAPDYEGKFYFKAISEGDGNHLPLASDWIEFEIIAVVPISLSVDMLRTEFLTLQKVSGDDIRVYIINNDSSKVEISATDINVSYANGDCFAFSDVSVAFSYLDFSVIKEISVKKREYDLSSVVWEGIRGVYDGEEKYATLTGLPEGIRVVEYVGNGAVDAGLYVISAVLDYDKENYNPPIIPSAVMTVEKQVVVIPYIESLEYNSQRLFPSIEDSDLYSFEFSGAVNAGSYTLIFILKDSTNYCFEGNTDTAQRSFEITKRKLTVRLSDVCVYLRGKHSEPQFEIISGELAEGEYIYPNYEIGEDIILATFNSENYEIEVLPGNVYRYSRLSPEDTGIAILIFFIIFLAIISILIIFINRKRLIAYYSHIFSKNDKFIPSMPILSEEEDAHAKPENTDFFEQENKSGEKAFYTETGGRSDTDVFNYESASDEENMTGEYERGESEPQEELEYHSSGATVIDAGYADSVITDSLARSLIRKDVEIETEGRKKQIINVDTLSRSFCAGERVDINLLKSKSLIPYDTGYIKVLARGIIDKPLNVYANDFSLSAVKMIALAGGKSVKVGKISSVRCIGKGNFKKRT